MRGWLNRQYCVFCITCLHKLMVCLWLFLFWLVTAFTLSSNIVEFIHRDKYNMKMNSKYRCSMIVYLILRTYNINQMEDSSVWEIPWSIPPLARWRTINDNFKFSSNSLFAYQAHTNSYSKGEGKKYLNNHYIFFLFLIVHWIFLLLIKYKGS